MTGLKDATVRLKLLYFQVSSIKHPVSFVICSGFEVVFILRFAILILHFSLMFHHEGCHSTG